MSTPTRVFLSFAPQDANCRSLLIGAARAARLPLRFVEMPNHVTDPRGRDALCRAKLEQCDLALVLLSRSALVSASIESDMRAVSRSGLPLHAVMAGLPRESVAPPPEWGVASLLSWSWPRIAAFLQRLPGGAPVERAAG